MAENVGVGTERYSRMTPNSFHWSALAKRALPPCSTVRIAVESGMPLNTSVPKAILAGLPLFTRKAANLAAPAKARLPRRFTLAGRFIWVMAAQFSKVPFSTAVNPSGSVIAASILQPLKASSPIAATDSGRASAVNARQPLKARAPMLLMPCGNVILASDVQSLKASSAIAVRPVNWRNSLKFLIVCPWNTVPRSFTSAASP